MRQDLDVGIFDWLFSDCFFPHLPVITPLSEAAGLKGATRGRAGVYERQALVLVNRGGATGAEILALAREVQGKVAAKFGVMLEPEPVII